MTSDSTPAIFIAPYEYGGGGLSQGPHTILAVRNSQTHYHRLVGEIPTHYYDPTAMLYNMQVALRGREKYVVLGGSHLITLGVLRARHETDGPVHLVLFDAHSDDYETLNPMLHGGNWVPVALAEGLVSGITWFNYRGEKKWGTRPARNAPVHISVDIDVLAPAQYAGASRFNEVGGCELSVLLQDIAEVRGEKITGDLVEYDPLLDTPGRLGGRAASKILDALLSVIDA